MILYATKVILLEAMILVNWYLYEDNHVCYWCIGVCVKTIT
jgi:hypothetical protein